MDSKVWERTQVTAVKLFQEIVTDASQRPMNKMPCIRRIVLQVELAVVPKAPIAAEDDGFSEEIRQMGSSNFNQTPVTV